MAAKRKPKRKAKARRNAKRAVGAAVLTVSVGAAAVLGHDEHKHIELMETGPDVAILTDAAIVATNTANAVLSLMPPVIPKK